MALQTCAGKRALPPWPPGVELTSDAWSALKERFRKEVADGLPLLADGAQAVLGANEAAAPPGIRVILEALLAAPLPPPGLLSSESVLLFAERFAQSNIAMRRALQKRVVAPPAKFLASDAVGIAPRVQAVQRVLDRLGYNHVTQLYPVNKQSSLRALNNLAHAMLAGQMPIKCLEAAVLAMHLTNAARTLVRMTLAFHTECCGQSYRHIVLAVAARSAPGAPLVWGAIGLSRRASLGGKPLNHASLVALVEAYRESYSSVRHSVQRIRLGQVIPHDPDLQRPLNWAVMSCHFRSDLWKAMVEQYQSQALDS